jgi:hypothetical protein
LLIGAALLLAPAQADAYVYWAHDSPSGIARAELSGIGANNNYLAGSAPAGVAVDSQHVYWTNTSTNTIGRANLDGTNVDQSFLQFTSGIGLEGVAVDSGHIYWTEANGGGAGDGALTAVVRKGKHATTDLASLFHAHALQPGAKVTVTVTQAHKTGLRWVFTTRAGGQAPDREGRRSGPLTRVP